MVPIRVKSADGNSQEGLLGLGSDGGRAGGECVGLMMCGAPHKRCAYDGPQRIIVHAHMTIIFRDGQACGLT